MTGTTEIEYTWRGPFDNAEVNRLHAAAFETRVFSAEEWDWVALTSRHSLGWVVARAVDGRLAGFANVLWDGLVHAWLQDVMVDTDLRHAGVGRRVVAAARDGAKDAGCEFLHVDFDADLSSFYLDACGFAPTNAGLLRLTR